MARTRTPAKLESDFQAHLIVRLAGNKDVVGMFPGCFILKNDSGYLQGVPDLLILFQNKWAMLEVKASQDAAEQPNQGYYVDLLDRMSFAAFIYPENEEEVLSDLQQAFQPQRAARLSQRQQVSLD